MAKFEDDQHISSSTKDEDRKSGSFDKSLHERPVAKDDIGRVHKLTTDASGALASASGMSLYFAFNGDAEAQSDGVSDDAFVAQDSLELDHAFNNFGSETSGSLAPVVINSDPELEQERHGLAPHEALDSDTVPRMEVSPTLTMSEVTEPLFDDAELEGRRANRSVSETGLSAGAGAVPVQPESEAPDFEEDARPSETNSPTDVIEVTATSTVTTTSADGSSATEDFTIAVSDVDEFDVTTPVDSNVAANTVSEDAANGTAVGVTASASDGDATTNGITYSLVDGSGDPIVGGPFAVDANSGVITVADNSQLDYESATSHTVTVKATSADGSSATEDFTIALTDVNDNAQVFTSATSVNAAENSADTAVLYTATATDADTTGEAITYTLTDNAGGLFEIDSSTGQVSLVSGQDIDFESGTSHDITIQSSDGMNTTTQTVTVNVTDTAETIQLADGGDTFIDTSVSETSILGGDGNDTIEAGDGGVSVSGNDGNDQLTGGSGADTITGGSGNDTIDGGDGTDTAIYTGNWADYAITENAGTYTLVDNRSGSPDGTDTVTNVENFQFADGTVAAADILNDAPTDISSSNTSGNLLVNGSFEAHEVTGSGGGYSTFHDAPGWNTDSGDVELQEGLGGQTATDGDQWLELDAFNEVDNIYQDVQTVDGQTYTLSLDVAQRSGYAADSNTVEVYWNGVLVDTIDPASADWSTHTFAVEGTGGMDRLEFREPSGDNDGVGSYIDNVSLTTDLGENAAAGTVAAVLSAADADSGIASETATYALTSDPSGFFEIVGDEVRVKAGADIDYETATSHDITVQVTDAHGQTYSEVVTINVADLNDTAQVFTSASSGTAAENISDGTVVYTATTTDADTTGETITYSLTDSAGGLFEIDANTGEVSLVAGQSLNFEAATSHDITIQSSDGTNTSTQTVTITVDDVAETITLADGGDTFVDASVSETAIIGGDGNDDVDAEGGNDTITGGGGNDDIDGGDGTDTAIYTGNWADYSITENAGTYTIVDNRSGSLDGTDTVTNVENFQFADGTVAVADILNDAPTDISASNTSGNLLVNGSFEVDEVTGTKQNFGSLVGWNTDSNNIELHEGLNGQAASDGDQWLELDYHNEVDNVYQDVQTVDGQTYTLSLDVAQRIGKAADTNSVEVYWNGVLVDTIDPASTDWSTHTFAVEGTGGMDRLEFREPSDDNDGAGSLIDNVSLETTEVDENSGGGTVAAVLTATDADSGIASETATFAITSDPSGFFEIVGNEVRVKSGASLDHETADSHDLVIQVTDANGATYSETLTISVADINEAPIDITFDVNSGVSINEDGGNNAYLSVVDSGDIVGGLSEMTIEINFSSTNDGTRDMNLFGYHAGGSSDEIEIGINEESGSVGLYIEIGENAVSIPSYDASQLLDGGDHQISVTWDNTAGDWEIFVDGASVASGTGMATGQTIASGGTIVLGQEQDSNGGGFDASQSFEGTYNDVRIFDDVRTPTEISNNVLSEVPTSEPGLVANWRMDDDLSDGVATESVSGKDMTVNTVTGTGWVASTPGQVANLNENSAAGTVVTTLNTIDPDSGDTFTYSITNDPSGHFEIVGDEVRVKSGADIDYETATSHDITIQVTDSGGLTHSETLTVDVANINDAPTDLSVTAAASASLDVNGAFGAAVANVSAVDADAGDSHTYSLTNDAGGRFAIDANTGEITLTGANATPVFTEMEGAAHPFDGIDVGSYATPTFVDIDNDGDLDMFAGDSAGTVEFIRNDGSASSPSFTHVGASQFGFADEGSHSTVSFGDLDNDGDFDAFVADDSGNIAYYRNDGSASSPSFTRIGNNQFGIVNAGGEADVDLVDLDNDGDLDLFIAKQDGTVSYQQNTGTASAPSFAAATTSPFGLSGDVGHYAKVSFADVDNDGDFDLLVGDSSGNSTYHENTGTVSSPTFATGVSNPFGLSDIASENTPAFADLDNDGDMDLVIGEDGGTFNYYENTGSVLDASSVESHTVTVETTDSGGLTHSEDITLHFGTDNAETITGTANDDVIYGFGATPVVQDAAQSIMDAGPVGYWRFGEVDGSTVAVDETGTQNGTHNNGMDLGFAGVNANDSDTSAEFDGSGDWVSIAHNSAYSTSEGTIQLWFNADSVSGDRTLVSKSGGGEELTIYITDGTLYAKLGDTMSGVSVGTNEWHHVSFSWGSSGLRLHVDGSLESSVGSSKDLVGNTGTLYVGRDAAGGKEFDGFMDEVVFFDQQLDTTEVADLYNTGLNGVEGSPGAVENTLNGGAGDDVLIGGAGADSLNGGTGTDTVDYSGSDSGVTVNLETGVGTGGDAEGDSYTSIESVVGSSSDDNVYGTATGGVTVDLGAGNDTFDNAAGDATQADIVDGGAGNDTIWTGAGNDVITGGTGHDTIHGEDGNDTITGNEGTDFLTGGAGSDVFNYSAGDDNDLVYGGAAGGWTDVIELQGMDGSVSIAGDTATGQGWTLVLDSGHSFDNQSGEQLDLSDDAAGTITFDDSSTISFSEIERVDW